MHELGHTLGLQHGGDDSTNNKPNYLSVMNYLFSLDGLMIDGHDGYLDYSRFGAVPSLDKTHLSESAGVNGGGPLARYGTKHHCQSGFMVAVYFSLSHESASGTGTRKLRRANPEADRRNSCCAQRRSNR